MVSILGQALALCPAPLQMPHSLGLFALGCPSETEGFAGVAEEVVGGSLEVVSGSLGLGHVMSWYSSGQNSRILLNRYHCRLELSPDGVIRSGSSVAVGFQSCFRRFTSTSSESDFSRTKTCPLWSAENRRWWKDLMPTHLSMCSARKVVQS